MSEQLNINRDKSALAVKIGYITAISITLFTVMLYTMMLLMSLGGVEMPNFMWWHSVILVISGALCYGFFKKNLITSVAFLILFVTDKILLIIWGLIPLSLGLPIILVITGLLVYGVIGVYRYNSFITNENHVIDDSKVPAKKEYSFFDSFILVFILILSAIVAHKGHEWGKILSRGGNSLGEIIGISIPIIVFIAFVLGTLSLLKKYIGKMHIAVMTILSITLSTAMTTVISQSGTVPHQPMEYYPATFGQYLSKLMIFFELHTIYHSWWFIGLFIFLIINIIFVISRRKFTLRNIGFHITHFSLIAILLAVWYNYFFSFSGIIQLNEGQSGNRVLLFKDSEMKSGKKFVDLDFSIHLDKFETKLWESSYKIFIKKFPDKLPEQIGSKTFTNLKNNLPPEFKQTIEQLYEEKVKLNSQAILTILSSVGLSYLSTLKVTGKHFVLKGPVDEKKKKAAMDIFKRLDYKGKDVTANPIYLNKKERIITTDITYVVDKYYYDFYYKYIPLPNKIKGDDFTKILDQISNQNDKSTILQYYKKNENQYTLKLDSIQTNEAKKIAKVFEKLNQQILLDNIPLDSPVVGLTVLNGPQKNDMWLNDKEKEGTNSHTFVPYKTKIIYYWDIDENKVKEILDMSEKKNQSPHRISFYKDKNKIDQLEVEIGKEYPIPNTEYKIKFEKFYNDFAFDRNSKSISNASNLPNNPAIEVIVSKKHQNGKAPYRLFLFEKYKDIEIPQLISAQKETGYKFDYSYNPNYNKMIVVGKSKSLYTISKEKNLIKQDIQFNVPYRLGERTKAFVYFKHIYHNSKQFFPLIKERINIPDYLNDSDFDKEILRKIKNDKDKKNIQTAYQPMGRFYILKADYQYKTQARKDIHRIIKSADYLIEPSNPVIQVTVTNGKKFSETFNLYANNIKTYPVDGSLYNITFESRKSLETKYWKSHITMYDLKQNPIKENGRVIRDTVKVNESMYYNGYRFYQTDAKKDDPSYSGIGVNKEPGLPYVYLSFITLCIGITLLFYFKPKSNENNASGD